VPALTANIFAVASNTTDIHHKERLHAPLISLFNEMSMVFAKVENETKVSKINIK